jgi:hypothetical protein
MRSYPILGTLLLLGACGGGSFPVTLTASPTASPADAVACVRPKLTLLGYEQTSYDATDLRVTARKIDTGVHRTDPRFRRNIDRLEIEAAPGADGKTSLKVMGRTFAEFETQRGPTEEEQRASAEVKQSAQAILDACGQP